MKMIKYKNNKLRNNKNYSKKMKMKMINRRILLKLN